MSKEQAEDIAFLIKMVARRLCVPDPQFDGEVILCPQMEDLVYDLGKHFGKGMVSGILEMDIKLPRQ